MSNKSWTRTYRTGFVLLLCVELVISGCSSLISDHGDGVVGTALKGNTPTRAYPSPFVAVVPKPTMIGLACSGGGSRAAYLTAAILREIRRIELGIELPGDFDRTGNLIGEIDYVSAVSGGALSAAYFVSNIEQLKTPAENLVWKQYLDKMSMNLRQREWYSLGLLNPLSWLKTLFTKYNRGNIARDDYDNQLYDGHTLGDLPDHPALYVNAFDVGNRVRFVFSKHFIDTDYYHERLWYLMPEKPQEVTAENDLVWIKIDPASVRIADAVYASSAFPFVYPNLALHHAGRNKIVLKGKYLFLADGGLADNSGLLTLLTQMKTEFDTGNITRLILGLYIDASIESFGSGTMFHWHVIENDYAWQDTYLGHGRASVEAAIDHHEETVIKFLESTGVFIANPNSDFESNLFKPIQVQEEPRSSWSEAVASGRLLMRPVVIGMRLRDIVSAYYGLWGRLKHADRSEKHRLMQLFEAAHISSGLEDDDPDTVPSKTNEELERRISEIKTDFVLRDMDRRVLDLSAYILVHGQLEPALLQWNQSASKRLKQMQ